MAEVGDGGRHTLSAVFRPPPSDPAVPYSPFVAPMTSNLIKEYTLPAIKSAMQELVVLGGYLIITSSLVNLYFYVSPGAWVS
jgi:hypothetical protein